MNVADDAFREAQHVPLNTETLPSGETRITSDLLPGKEIIADTLPKALEQVGRVFDKAQGERAVGQLPAWMTNNTFKGTRDR